MGSDIKGKLGLRTIRSPFKDEELIAYPPIEPDVAIIHIQRSDMYGNAHLEGVTAIDDQLIKASKRSGKIEEYLKKYVSSLDSFQEYLDKIGKNSLTRVKPKQ